MNNNQIIRRFQELTSLVREEKLSEAITDSIVQKLQEAQNTYTNNPNRVEFLLQNPPININKTGTPNFVGMGMEIEFLKQQLIRSDGKHMVGVYGMPGVGKTELARQFVVEYQSHFPGGVIYVNTRFNDLKDEILLFAKSNFNTSAPEDLNPTEKISYCWKNWGYGRLLLIVDDFKALKDVQPYFPPAHPKNKILTITRHFPGSNVIATGLEPFSSRHSLAMLGHLIGEDRLEKEAEQADALCNLLGHLPLALELVGRYLDNRPTFSLKEIVKRITRDGMSSNCLRFMPDYGDMGHEIGLKTTLELSSNDLPQTSKLLACLISRSEKKKLSFADIEEIAYPVIHHKEELETAIDAYLVRENLLQVSGDGLYSMNPAIAMFFKAQHSV